MKPKAAYDDIAGRARALLRLHKGLLNNRQRRIRSDWKNAFCRVMHWPLASQIERVDSTDAIIVLRQGSALTPSDFAADSLEDLLRTSLTFGVSALDRYVHESVVKGIVTSLRKKDLIPRQAEFSIPATIALGMGKHAADARRNRRQFRPANVVRNQVQETLHSRPLQSWREIEYAFELLGISGLAGRLQAAYQLPDINTIKTRLNEIVRKRNLIVHEGDLVRHQRAGHVRRIGVTSQFVQESLGFLDTFVSHLDAIS